MTNPYQPAPEQSGYPGQPFYPQPGYGQGYPHGYPPPYGYYPQPVPSNGKGITGFVLGLLGLILFWFPFVGLALGVLGVVLSALGMQVGKRTGASNGLAIAGLVCGLVSLIPGVLIIVAVANS